MTSYWDEQVGPDANTSVPIFDGVEYNIASAIIVFEVNRNSYAEHKRDLRQEDTKLNERWTSLAAIANGGALTLLAKEVIALTPSTTITNVLIVSSAFFLTGLLCAGFALRAHRQATSLSLVAMNAYASVALKMEAHYKSLQQFILDDPSRKHDDILMPLLIDRDNEFETKIGDLAQRKVLRQTTMSEISVYVGLFMFAAGIITPLVARANFHFG